MGEPILVPEKIPVLLNEKCKVQNKKIQVPILVNNTLYKFTCISMGNPHAVTFINNIDNFNIEKYGPIFENSKFFPERANIEFAQIINRETIKMRVWERGAGETLACGTGACACLVASSLNNYTNKKVTVKLLGGNLEIEWKKDNHIYMTGPAVTVFKGEWINA